MDWDTHEEEQSKEETIEVAGEEGEVVVCRGSHTVQDRRDGVEDVHRCRVSQ